MNSLEEKILSKLAPDAAELLRKRLSRAARPKLEQQQKPLDLPLHSEKIELERVIEPTTPVVPAARAGSKRHLAAARATQRRLTRAEKQRRREVRSRLRDDRVLARLTEKMRLHGGDPSHGLRLIGSDTWTMSAQVCADATGRAARIYLARCPSRAFAGGVLRAALLLDDDGRPTGKTQSWASLRTRRIAAYGLDLWALSKRTKRRGPWKRIVTGITRGAFCKLLADPFDQRECGTPSVSALYGTHRAGSVTQVGYLKVLVAAGVVYRQQMRRDQDLEACERGWPSGHAPNRYWLAADVDDVDPGHHRDRLAALHMLAYEDAGELEHQREQARQRAAAERAAAPP